LKATLRRVAARLMLRSRPLEAAVRFCCRRPRLNRFLQTGGIVIAIPEVANGPVDRIAQLDGFKMWVDLRNRASAMQYFYGKSEVPDFVDRIVKVGDTCFDIGANFGVFTCHLARLVGPTGRVMAFEPNPSMREYLCKSVALNKYENRVTIYESAVCDQKEQKRKFFVNSRVDNTGLSSLLPPSERNISTVGFDVVIEVETTTIDDEIAQNALPNVRFAKIDVEDAGESVIRGAVTALHDERIDAIMIESHHMNSDLMILSKFGLTCHWIVGDGLAPADYRPKGQKDLFAFSQRIERSITDLIRDRLS